MFPVWLVWFFWNQNSCCCIFPQLARYPTKTCSMKKEVLKLLIGPKKLSDICFVSFSFLFLSLQWTNCFFKIEKNLFQVFVDNQVELPCLIEPSLGDLRCETNLLWFYFFVWDASDSAKQKGFKMLRSAQRVTANRSGQRYLRATAFNQQQAVAANEGYPMKCFIY